MEKIPKNKIYLIVNIIVAILFICLIIIYFSKQKTQDIPAPIIEIEEVIATTTQPVAVVPTKLYRYIEIIDSCGVHFGGVCVNMRSGPGREYPSKGLLRNGIVLRVMDDTVTVDGKEWYRIVFAQNLLYPERAEGDHYVAAAYGRSFYNEGDKYLKDKGPDPITKRIVVDISEQTLYAYEGDRLFMQQKISTGLDLTPTRTGIFFVHKKTPSRYMQGPTDKNVAEDSDQYYDLPGVPWDMYFTYEGDVIHGAYWHDNFGKQWSHGCVNLPMAKSEELYLWTPIGTPVFVED